jgi:hypothetical protein
LFCFCVAHFGRFSIIALISQLDFFKAFDAQLNKLGLKQELKSFGIELRYEHRVLSMMIDGVLISTKDTKQRPTETSGALGVAIEVNGPAHYSFLVDSPPRAGAQQPWQWIDEVAMSSYALEKGASQDASVVAALGRGTQVHRNFRLLIVFGCFIAFFVDLRFRYGHYRLELTRKLLAPHGVSACSLGTNGPRSVFRTLSGRSPVMPRPHRWRSRQRWLAKSATRQAKSSKRWWRPINCATRSCYNHKSAIHNVIFDSSFLICLLEDPTYLWYIHIIYSTILVLIRLTH